MPEKLTKGESGANTAANLEHSGRLRHRDRVTPVEVFVGRLLGLRAVVSFHADSVAKLKREMHVAVDEYVASCERRGESPEKPLSGNVPLRMPPEVHGRAAVLAEASGKSLNQLVESATRQLPVVEKMNRTAKSAAPGVTVHSMAGELTSAKKAARAPTGEYKPKKAAASAKVSVRRRPS